MWKHLSVGMILIIVGLILAPSGTPEDLVTTVPMIAVLGVSLYALVALAGYAMIVLGVALVGKGALKLLGPFAAVFKHPVVLLLVIIGAGLVIWRYLL